MNEHFYEQLKIENFRGIKSLEIDDLARVNLFVGRNNCGKTSVLEAAFLLTGMSNPALIPRIENSRGLFFNESSDLKNFFYDQKHNEGFTLSGKQRTERRELKVIPVYGDFDVGQVASAPSNGGNIIREGDPIKPAVFSTAIEQSLTGLKSKFDLWSHVDKKNGKDCQREATIRLVESGDTPFRIELDEKYEEPTLALFLHGSYSLSSIDRMLDKKHKDDILNWLQSSVARMLNGKHKNDILRWIQYIEPKVQDIKINKGIVMVDIGMDNFLPINHLGDGIVRILNILSYIYSTRNGILMIDEIENGLHVSSMRYVWDMVLYFSEQNNTQIFMTTHSGDVIKGLSLALIDRSDSVAGFWLSKFDDRIKAYRYSSDGIKNALEVGIDIRH